MELKIGRSCTNEQKKTKKNEQTNKLKFSVDFPFNDFPNEKFSGNQRFTNFVQKLAVVNDAGERGVKAIQEVVSRTTSESLRQDMMVTHGEERKKFPNKGAGKETKRKLAKL